MLTPAQLNDISFERLKGDTYNAAEVDSALAQIAEDYSAIFAENADMVKKLGILAAKLEEYRKDENVLRDVLYNAQKSADLIIAAANDQADGIIRSAEEQVSDIKAEADGIIDTAMLKAEKINAAAEAEYASIISSAKVLSEGYISAARETADNVTSETEKTVNDLIGDCNSKAAAILENAQAKANELLDDAKVASEAMIVNAEGDVISLWTGVNERAQKIVVSFGGEGAAVADSKSSGDTVSKQIEGIMSDIEAALVEANNVKNDAENKAFEILNTAKKAAETIMTEAKENSVNLITTSQSEADSVIEAANKNSLDKLEEAKLRCENAIGQAKVKAVELLSSKNEQLEVIYNDALKTAEELKDSAKEQADTIIEGAKAKAAEIIECAKNESENFRIQSEENVNGVLAQVDDTVEKKLVEAKLKCDSMLKLAKAEAETRIDKAEATSNEYFRQSQSNAAALMIAVNSECEKKLSLVKKEISKDSDMFFTLKMPETVRPLDESVDADAMLKANGFNYGFNVEKPKFSDDPDEISGASIEKSEKIAIGSVNGGFSETKRMIADTTSDGIAEELGLNGKLSVPDIHTAEETEAEFEAVMNELPLQNIPLEKEKIGITPENLEAAVSAAKTDAERTAKDAAVRIAALAGKEIPPEYDENESADEKFSEISLDLNNEDIENFSDIYSDDFDDISDTASKENEPATKVNKETEVISEPKTSEKETENAAKEPGKPETAEPVNETTAARKVDSDAESDADAGIFDTPEAVFDDFDNIEDFEDIDFSFKNEDAEFESLNEESLLKPDFDEAPGAKSPVTEEAFSAENGFNIDFSVFEDIPEAPVKSQKAGRKGKNKNKK